MWQRPTNDGSGLHVYGGDEGRKYYIRKKELWEMDQRFFTRENTIAIWTSFVTIFIVTQEITSWNSLDHCRGLNYLLRSIFVLLIHSLNHLQLLLHSLKPSSSTHPLQIYCIGLNGLEFIYPSGIVHKSSPYTYPYL